MHPARGAFCFYSKFDFRARLSRFVMGQVFTRVWLLTAVATRFLRRDGALRLRT